jgi:hypothetical protein
MYNTLTYWKKNTIKRHFININPTWVAMGVNLGILSEKPESNNIISGTAEYEIQNIKTNSSWYNSSHEKLKVKVQFLLQQH